MKKIYIVVSLKVMDVPDSIIMSKKCAIKLCNFIDKLLCKIFLHIDHWLNVLALVYWAEPTIIILNNFISYIVHNNLLM